MLPIKQKGFAVSTFKKVDRRTILQFGLGATMGVEAANLLAQEASGEDAEMTPDQQMGPFYPVHDQDDKDVDLTRITGHAERAQGAVIYVQGCVSDEHGASIPGALVEVWQANKWGRYSHERDPNPAPLDPNFQGWGQATTDAQGSYRFRTIKPGSYPLDDESSARRTPHIHFRVARRGFHELVTQMYFQGEPLNDQDELVQLLSDEERTRVIIAPDEGDANAEPDVRTYRFAITLRKVRPDRVPIPVLDTYVGRYALQRSALLDGYVGQYFPGVEPGSLILTISRDGEQLYAEAPIQPKVEIRPLSETQFSFKAMESVITFQRNDAGHVESLTLRWNIDAPDVEGKKIE
jgi:protocatechuate 3,4-dioxygenase beta subunit